MKEIKPYPLSPTIGTIQEHKIVGREKEIISVLRLLQGQSVSVEEIRRMGKTLLVQKLAYWCNSKDLLPDEFKEDNFKAKYFTFQGQKNLAKLIEYLLREFESLKKWHQVDFSKTYNVITKILKVPQIKAYGAEISINLPKYEKYWKNIFSKILEDISNSLEKNETKLILIFDELPIMLWDWYKQGNHKEAIELLDILRERRQNLENKGLRFIFCGSIGINIILNTLRTEFGYTGEPTNEMAEYSVGTFNLQEVEFLCECYALSGFFIKESDKMKIWKLIYKLSNGIPFYISKFFNIIQTEYDKDLTKKNIENSYNAILNDTKHHGAFIQLRERIITYYPNEKAKTMITVLSFLSKHKGYVSEENIIKGINLEDKDIKSGLYELLSDHYLLRKTKKGQRYYKIKYKIFRQWWKINIA